MKKMFILFIILFCGCSKEFNVTTIVERNSNSFICINYPITNQNNLDSVIENYVLDISNSFKENLQSTLENKAELNIDYTYYKVNQYTNISLTSYINDTKKEKYLIKTFLYDEKNDRFLSSDDVIEGFISDIFTFDNKYLYTYEYENNNINIRKKLLSDLNTKINISKQNKSKITKSIENKNKVLDPNQKFIALTFDDGPSIYTKKIIDLLKKYNVTATFFILGNKVEIYRDVLTDSISYGNEIGNHSYNHKWLVKLNDNDIKEQVSKTQDIIKNVLNYTPKVFRPTYGSLNEKIKNDIDLNIVLWNVDTLDWKYKNVNSIFKRATKNLKDGNIILMHDTYKTSYEALKKIIPYILDKGFTFVTISEMEEIKKIREYEK